MSRNILFTPGPVEVHPDVASACAEQPLYHRSKEFREISQMLWENLKTIYSTSSPVLVLAGSATIALESAMAATIETGDVVVVISNGRFAERLVKIATMLGARVEQIVVQWGQSIQPETLEKFLKTIPTYQSLWMIHGETSTGALQPLEKVAALSRRVMPQALVCADVVTSLGVHDVQFDAWQLDIAVTGSQKGLQCFPGLSCVALSPLAIERLQTLSAQRSDGAAGTRFASSLETYLDQYNKGLFPFTPPVSIVRGLSVATTKLLELGLQNSYENYSALKGRLHTTLAQNGYKLFGDVTLNAMCVVEEANSQDMIAFLLERGVQVSNGQDHLANRVIRIGLMGHITSEAEQRLFTGIVDFVRTEKSVT